MPEKGSDWVFRRDVRVVSVLVLFLLVVGLATAIDPPPAQAEQPAPVADVGPAEAADVPSARATARLQNRRIEALSERTETATTWVNPDGTRTTEFNGGPIRVRRDDAWVPVDLTLRRYDDGSVRPVAHPHDLVIAGAGGAAGTPRDLASVQAPQGRIALQYPGVLPEPVLEGTSALFREVQPGVDLRVTATRSGFEQFFVVKRRPARPLDLTLPVRAEGLTTRTDADGNTELVAPDGAVVGSVPAATMWDARTDPASGDPLRVVRVGGRVAAVPPVAVEGRAPTGGVDVDVEVDPGFFNDPAVAYPVTVDPGVTIHTGFDTYTETGVTTDQSASTELRLGTYNGGTTKARSFLHFDVAALLGHQVLSADLRLFATHSASCEARNWEVWDTGLVSTSTRWTNQPPPYTRWTTTGTTRGSGGCPGDWTSTNVASLIQSWANRSVTTGALLLKAENESDSLGWKKFSSAEGGAVPHLVVTYNRIPDVATGLAITDRGDHGGMAFTRSLTPTLSFTPRDPDGDVVSVVFYVYDGDNMIHDEWVRDVPSGSVARWTVPPGMLVDGQQYRFRATTMDATRAFADDAWVRLRSLQTGQVADVAGCGITNGTPVMQAPNNGSDCQRWFPWGTGDGYHHFRVRHSGQVLDNNGCSTTEGNPVGTHDQAGGDCQKWAIERFGNGEYKFAVKNANKVLDQGCTTANVQLTVKDRRSDGCQSWAMDLAPNNGASVNWLTVTTDTTLPGAPFVSSTDYPSDQNWHRGAGQAGTFRFTAAPNLSPPVAYLYGLDSTPVTEVAAGTGATGTTDALVPITPSTEGRHVLNVRAKDQAGNLSGVASYPFNVGRAGLLRPGDGERTPARVPITLSGQPALDNVKFFWRRGPGATTEAGIPLTHLRRADGTPLTVSAQGYAPVSSIPDGVYWTATDTLGSAAGVVEVKAVLSEVPEGTNPYTTGWRTVVVDPDADGAASTDIAGGALNLLTGDFTQSTTDVQEFGLSVSRSTSSRDPRAGYQPQRERLTPNQQQLATDTAGFTTAMADIARVTDRGHETAESLRITPRASGSMGADTFTSIEGDSGALRLGMRPGRLYRVTGWIFVPAATGLTPTDVDGLKIVAFTSGGSTGTRRYASTTPTATDAWQQLTVDIAVPSDATSAYVRLYNGFSVGTGKHVYYDDLSVRELHAPFGPQWRGGTSVDADAIDYTRLTVTGAVVQLETVDGRSLWFTRGNGGAYFPEPGAEDLRLAFDGTTFTLNEIDDTVTTFTQQNAGAAWTVATTTPPAAASTTRYTYETVDDRLRVARVIARVEAGIGDCTTPTPARGCEVLQYSYATATTATPTALGDVVDQVRAVSAWTTDPATGTVSQTEVARYSYDNTGRLREVWDPRISPALITRYDYDTAGRLVTTTPPGELPWQFDLGQAGPPGDPNPGRLLRVRRSALAEGSVDQLDGETATTIVYKVPLTRTAGGPHDLDTAAVATWAQPDAPTDATAVFPPQEPAAAATASATVPGRDGYRTAEVHYLDASGREANTATPGGWIDSRTYDRFGNVTRALSARHRALALAPATDPRLAELGLAQADTATRATRLDTQTRYSGDGLDKLSETTPLRYTVLPEAPDTPVTARSVTEHLYDEGRPDGLAYHLPTTTLGYAIVDGRPGRYDPRITRTTYAPTIGGASGWGLRVPTQVSTNLRGTDTGFGVAAGGDVDAVTTQTAYDDRGRVTQVRSIGATGTDARTTLTAYWTAGAHPSDAACGNRPEWAGELCTTRAGGAVTGHDGARMPGELPVERVTGYSRFGDPTIVTETAAGVTRTTTTGYDSAGRVTSVAVSGGLGTATPAVATLYDPATGRETTDRFTDGTSVTTAFDRLGRVVRYTDADTGFTATEYDRFGQPVRVTDSTGAVQTMTYDRAAEPRGLLTRLTDSVAGTFDPVWDVDSQMVELGMPGGIRMVQATDPAGVPTTRTYRVTATNAVVASSVQTIDINAQRVRHVTSTFDQRYTYDSRRRLTAVTDTATGTGLCSTRTYTLDARSNRTGKTVRNGTGPGTCPTPGVTPTETTVHTHDTADRAQDPGLRYDAFGRITNLSTTGGELINAFHTNDLVASQTQGDQRQIWTLDPGLRFRTYQSERFVNNAWANAVTKVNHYGDGSDEPRWIVEDTTLPDNLTRNVSGPDGHLAATTGKTGGITLQLTSLHGDVMATLPVTGTTLGAVTLHSTDEFGVPQNTAAATSRYSWLGAHQRSQDALADTILMGVRLYHPATGRFLSVDPEPGGSATAYDYGNHDPVNTLDLDGKAFFIPLLIIAGRLAVQACIRYCAQVARAVMRTAPRARPRPRPQARPPARSCPRWNSFAAHTLVQMADGSLREISTIAIGDIVIATDSSTGETSAQPVLDVLVGYGNRHLIELDVSPGPGGSVTATGEHPIWVRGRGWTEAQHLHAGAVLSIAAEDVRVEQIVDRGHVAASLVYNLSVANLHTFSIVAGGREILTHNCPAERGRSRNNMGPDRERTSYPHTVIRRGRDGRIEHYQTFYPNSRAPNGWSPGPRFRGSGRPHGPVSPPIFYPNGSGRGAIPAPRNTLPRGY